VVANAGMLQKPDVVAYVGANAQRYGLDPAAVLAVADHEGLNTTPGSYWQLPKEWGQSFGPPSWYQGGAGGAIVNAQGSVQAAANWSWTPAGLDYWLQAIQAAGASGLTGYAAIKQIVGGYGWGFERPADPSADINNAVAVYDKYAQQVQTVVGNPGLPGIITVPNPIPIPGQPAPNPIPGQTGPGQLPTPTNPTAPAQPVVAAPFSLGLFDTPFGPFNLTLPWDFSGILLFLAAVFAIIIGAILWKPTREAGKTAVMVGAMA